MSIDAKLKELYDKYKADPAFDHMREDDINFVKGTGTYGPAAMLIGEAPGSDENAQCVPFVGKAGIELRRLLKLAEVDTRHIFLTNVVKYWPRNEDRKTRKPTDEEVEASKSYLSEEINIISPTFIVLCGKVSTRAIFPNVYNMKKINGKLVDKKYLTVYHPALTLYKPEMKDEVLSGYRILASLIDSLE